MYQLHVANADVARTYEMFPLFTSGEHGVHPLTTSFYKKESMMTTVTKIKIPRSTKEITGLSTAKLKKLVAHLGNLIDGQLAVIERHYGSHESGAGANCPVRAHVGQLFQGSNVTYGTKTYLPKDSNESKSVGRDFLVWMWDRNILAPKPVGTGSFGGKASIQELTINSKPTWLHCFFSEAQFMKALERVAAGWEDRIIESLPARKLTEPTWREGAEGHLTVWLWLQHVTDISFFAYGGYSKNGWWSPGYDEDNLEAYGNVPAPGEFSWKQRFDADRRGPYRQPTVRKDSVRADGDYSDPGLHNPGTGTYDAPENSHDTFENRAADRDERNALMRAVNANNRKLSNFR